MTDRIPCCIPGCRRTFKADVAFHRDSDNEAMCGRHFRMADDRFRRRYKQLRARERRALRLLTRVPILQARTLDNIANLQTAFEIAFLHAWRAIKDDVIPKAALGAEDAPRRKPREELRP